MKWNDDHIEAYLNGDLDKSQAEAFARHLAQRPAEAALVREHARVREALRMAAPEVPSQRMWQGIRARIAAGEGLSRAARKEGFWEGLLEYLGRPNPVLRWGFAGAALLVLAVGLKVHWPGQPGQVDRHLDEAAQPIAAPPSPAVATQRKEVLARKPAQTSSTGGAQFAPEAPGEDRAQAPAPAPAPARASKGPTEVEQALADQDVNQAMNEMLVEKEQMGGRSYLAAPSTLATTVGLGSGGNQPSRVRSMAVSNLSLQSPAAQSQLPQLLNRTGLAVESAGRAQYFPESRVAVYSGGVVAHMAALRSEGDALQLNLGEERVSFSAGTHFVRLVSDEGSAAAPVKVIGRDGAEVGDNEFNAPRGADYLRSSGELRLK